jgi:hypothetical protein
MLCGLPIELSANHLRSTTHIFSARLSSSQPAPRLAHHTMAAFRAAAGVDCLILSVWGSNPSRQMRAALTYLPRGKTWDMKSKRKP